MTGTIYTKENWAELIEAMHSYMPIEIDDEVFDYFLEVLPPVYMGRVKEVGNQRRRVSFGFAEGYEEITDFWVEKGRFFCQRSREMNTCC